MEAAVRRGMRGPARPAIARYGVRSRRDPLRRGLEAPAGRTGGVPEPAGDLQSGRWRRRADGGSGLAESAAGSRRGRRPDRPNDRICRPARADASPAGALSASQPAREALGAEISMAGECRFGRHHGPGHAGRERRPGAAASRLSRFRLEPQCEGDRGRRMLSRPRAARCVSRTDRHPGLPAAAHAGHATHPEPRIVRKTEPQQPDGRAGPDQCRARRPAERGRHSRLSR